MANKDPKPAFRRRDGAGHLDPKYAADLLARSKENAKDGDAAFVLEHRSPDDDLAEQLGEAFVRTATSGEDCAEDAANEVVPEETGGPFVDSSADREFAYDTDESNPEGAEREPFPKT